MEQYRVDLGKGPRSCSITGRRSGRRQKGHIAATVGEEPKPCGEFIHF